MCVFPRSGVSGCDEVVPSWPLKHADTSCTDSHHSSFLVLPGNAVPVSHLSVTHTHTHTHTYQTHHTHTHTRTHKHTQRMPMCWYVTAPWYKRDAAGVKRLIPTARTHTHTHTRPTAQNNSHQTATKKTEALKKVLSINTDTDPPNCSCFHIMNSFSDYWLNRGMKGLSLFNLNQYLSGH